MSVCLPSTHLYILFRMISKYETHVEEEKGCYVYPCHNTTDSSLQQIHVREIDL